MHSRTERPFSHNRSIRQTEADRWPCRHQSAQWRFRISACPTIALVSHSLDRFGWALETRFGKPKRCVSDPNREPETKLACACFPSLPRSRDLGSATAPPMRSSPPGLSDLRCRLSPWSNIFCSMCVRLFACALACCRFGSVDDREHAEPIKLKLHCATLDVGDNRPTWRRARSLARHTCMCDTSAFPQPAGKARRALMFLGSRLGKCAELGRFVHSDPFHAERQNLTKIWLLACLLAIGTSDKVQR